MPSVPISVIIPSFNHAPYLRACIDSVLAQQPAPVQVVVVDDGSTDASLDILRSYGDRITLLQQVRGRQARARNAGLAVARADWVAFLDSDDCYRPGRLAAVQAALQTCPEATLVWSDFNFVDAQGQLLRPHRWKGRDLDFRRTLIAGNPICNATVTVRRAALQALGGFDESLPRACDGAAWYQLAAAGHRFVHVNDILVDYRLHGNNDSARFAAMTRDRDHALLAAAKAYLQNGVLSTAADLVWLRKVLMGQFSFRAAAWVQSQRASGAWSRTQVAALEALGSDAGLRAFALLKRLKDLRGGP
jgi:glycosyltransferase involved in cell wall biosynthesis